MRARARPPLAILAALSALPSPAAAEPPVVTVVVVGRFAPELVEAIARGLGEELPVEVRRADAVPLPREAYYPPRRRYRADRILTFLHDHPARAAGRVLALTDVDVSTTKGKHVDWGVFGLGEVGGRAAVVSSFRLRRGARDAAHLRFRVVDVAIHEVGHMLGLPHCTEPRCIMLDAEGSITSVDTSSGHLGPGCRALVAQNLAAPP